MRDGLKMVNGDCLEVLKDIESDSIGCILTDPPYKYLKGQKLDRDFDETIFFPECRRVLKKDGFIVLFGRGTSFYRWNTRLDDLGFTFKEEIIWDKSYSSSPVTPITRIHESVSIHSISGAVKTAFVPYTEIKTDFQSIHQDVKRIKSALGNREELADLLKFLETGLVEYKDHNRTLGCNTTVQTAMSQQSRGVKTMQAITRGMKEKSIVRIKRDHYKAVHPTQKPVRLLERILSLTTQPGDTVLDPFAGSFSTGIACLNTDRNFIGVEIDSEYYEAGSRRMNDHQKPQEGLFDEYGK